MLRDQKSDCRSAYHLAGWKPSALSSLRPYNKCTFLCTGLQGNHMEMHILVLQTGFYANPGSKTPPHTKTPCLEV